ncbi:VanZ family protein [Nocardioides panacis]|uniref:VanZ family protein n=1 Tax=Nocardioides panacis TaxID=2849501 RepID=A0A975SZH3_9ACTN|nr:VanZ family protein [Nocardioides panacis]QWZ08094.1 VanZ family protein [Nocardioides panacis]
MTRSARVAGLLLSVYLVLLLVALLAPESGRQTEAVYWLQHLLARVGVDGPQVTYDRLEVVGNALIVVPVALLGSEIRPAWSWRDWTALAFLGSLAVETVQGLLLPDRQAAFSDVVANTVGALAGALLFRLLRPMLRAKGSER